MPKHLPVTLSLVAASLLVLGGPAWASLASDTFKDIPDGHWAQQGVAEVAIKRDLMKGYPDGTFRGDQPFTRSQFADSLASLIKELEALSKVSWRPAEHPLDTFADLKPSPQRDTVLLLANDYGLFEGVPGITSDRFNPERTVTRYEMAKIINNLMRLAEAKDVVRPRGKVGDGPTFTDVKDSDWAFKDLVDVSQRYRVMVGFPDGTFRGPEELTRYQYAQAISQTVPLIRELIAETVGIKREEKRLAEGPWRLQETQPFRLDAGAGVNATAQIPAIRGRVALYPDNWFVLSDLRLQLQSGTVSGQGAGGTAGDLELGGFTKLPMWDSFQVQPYLGLRAYVDGAPSGMANFFGPQGGLVAYYRPQGSPFGFYAKGGGSILNGSGGWTPFMTNLEGGFEVHVLPTLAITVGLGNWEAPSGYPAALSKSGVMGLSGGVQFGF